MRFWLLGFFSAVAIYGAWIKYIFASGDRKLGAAGNHPPLFPFTFFLVAIENICKTVAGMFTGSWTRWQA
jgi:hypothetical protein